MALHVRLRKGGTRMDKPNMIRARWFGLGLGLVSLMLAFACGGGQDGTVSSDQMAPPEQQVLRLRLSGEPKTIDPHLANFTGESTLTKPLFQGLFTYNEELKVVPALASELPTVDNGGISRDGMTYTIKLEKD